MTPQERIDAACNIAYRYGSTEGRHHKQWIIDQMVRALLGDIYPYWVEDFEDGGDGGDGSKAQLWDEGIPP